ncbi:MAG: DUF6398 domain-containing protein [Prevotella sp.]|jgi:hypothetical protein|nr:DUF6398 domain-containing protein [Prevotella sp.]MCH4099101.1 DUF6398 domain-containing protein [Prevotella sp.]MCI1323742.1 DUF6398 domain-containing protein [Prevotella sp.]MCI1348951.1 DUF6398 domain-containing protein [Prevotella sp.]
MEKAELKDRENRIAEMVTTFCQTHIDKEYTALCKKMVRKLGRKRTNPLERGRIEIWAAAIVYTVATMNFLFDKSFEPYIPSSTIHDYFGTKQSSVTQKSAQIRKMLKLRPYWDKDFSTNYMLENNPLNNMSMMNGFFFLDE